MRFVEVSLQGIAALELGDLEAIVKKLRKRHCVFLAVNDDVDALAGHSISMADHGWKHGAKGLKAYLLKREQRLQAIRTEYTSAKRLVEQGLRPLLKEAEDKDCPASFLVGTPGALFGALWSELRGEEDEAPDAGAPASAEERLLALLPDVRVPAILKRRFRGHSVEADLVRRLIVIAAGKAMPVLVQGETGTGKEIVAQSIHRLSKRKGHLIRVNCGALPADLFESELFGYEPGAFTGAARRGKKGLWENANEGTLFLDEIADLALPCQVKVLRALDSNRIRRVGGDLEYRVSARVIAATNRNLFQMVEAGSFREDLYYRLRQFFIRTPEVDDEGSAMGDVIQELWRDVTGEAKAVLSPGVVKLLAERRWVGNYREVKNVLQMLNEMREYFRSDVVLPEHVRALMGYGGPAPAAGHGASEGVDASSTLRRLDCLHHLGRAGEILRAIQVALGALSKRRGGAPEDLSTLLQHHVMELDMLLRKPLSFGKMAVFEEVRAARECVGELAEGLARGASRVRGAQRGQVAAALDGALERLFAETEALSG